MSGNPTCYGELRLGAALPLPPEPLSVSALSELTALPASAFVPERAQPSERDAVSAPARPSPQRSCSPKPGQWAGNSCAVCASWRAGAAAALGWPRRERDPRRARRPTGARGFVLQSVAFALQPRDFVFAEAGHFLAAYLLGVLPPRCSSRRLRWGARVPARVVWHSAEWDLAAAQPMHGTRRADGGHAPRHSALEERGQRPDERAAQLVLERARTGMPATSSSGDQASGDAAFLLLRENADALDALRRDGASASAGECAGRRRRRCTAKGRSVQTL